MSKPIQISTEAVRGNIIPTNVSKKKKTDSKQRQMVASAWTSFKNLFLAKETFIEKDREKKYLFTFVLVFALKYI